MQVNIDLLKENLMFTTIYRWIIGRNGICTAESAGANAWTTRGSVLAVRNAIRCG
jgi:hypothetical protein